MRRSGIQTRRKLANVASLADGGGSWRRVHSADAQDGDGEKVGEAVYEFAKSIKGVLTSQNSNAKGSLVGQRVISCS